MKNILLLNEHQTEDNKIAQKIFGAILACKTHTVTHVSHRKYRKNRITRLGIIFNALTRGVKYVSNDFLTYTRW